LFIEIIIFGKSLDNFARSLPVYYSSMYRWQRKRVQNVFALPLGKKRIKEVWWGKCTVVLEESEVPYCSSLHTLVSVV